MANKRTHSSTNGHSPKRTQQNGTYSVTAMFYSFLSLSHMVCSVLLTVFPFTVNYLRDPDWLLKIYNRSATLLNEAQCVGFLTLCYLLSPFSGASFIKNVWSNRRASILIQCAKLKLSWKLFIVLCHFVSLILWYDKYFPKIS